MGPALPPAGQAMQVFADPAVRTQVRQWHLDEVPFLDMIDRLGLSAQFVGPLRDAIANLSAEEVGIIRKAFIGAIDRAGDSEGASFPVACMIRGVPGPVTVMVLDKGGEAWARVVPAK
jgi:hypothetical protein